MFVLRAHLLSDCECEWVCIRTTACAAANKTAANPKCEKDHTSKLCYSRYFATNNTKAQAYYLFTMWIKRVAAKRQQQTNVSALHAYTSIRMKEDKKAFQKTLAKQNKWHLVKRELRLCLRVCMCRFWLFSCFGSIPIFTTILRFSF